jgi:hypothetical protein
MSNVASEVAVSEVAAPVLTGAVVLDALCAPVEKPKKTKQGRPFHAAKCLFEAGGVNAVITDDLAKKVDEACGKPNKTESLVWLKIAAQMCAGWEAGKAEKK